MAEVNGITWHIVPNGQRLTTQISPSGNGFQSIWEVTYMIDTGPAAGTEGVVNVPASQYNAQVVKAAINAQVTHQHNIASL
jgi:hypothetical protein